MLKKCVISVLLISWISSISLIAYHAFQPQAAVAIEEQAVMRVANIDENAKIVAPTEMSETTTIAETETSIEETEPTEEAYVLNYYYFCTSENSDCIFTNEYVLSPLAKELEVSEITTLQYYDLSELSESWTPARIKNEWGFDNYPAFVAIATYPDETQEVMSVLQWSEEKPLNTELLKIWMIENNIWTGIIEEQGELIEEPSF